jgi:Na+-driven multidrug efflux pump
MKNTLVNIKEKGLNSLARTAVIFCGALSQVTAVSAFASDDDPNGLGKVTEPIIDLVNNVFNILIPVVAAVGALFCIVLGVKFAKAEEPQDREKAKQHLKNAIIGFVLIFILVVVLRLATPRLLTWMNNASAESAVFNGFLF